MRSYNTPEPCLNILKTFWSGVIHFEGVTPPILQANLEETSSESQWVVESYVLLFVTLMLTGGALRDWIS